MEEEERTFTPGQAEAMDALLSGRNVFLSGNAGTGKSYVLNAFIEELEEREVPYLAMAPTGIAAQNLHNGTTIHRTLQVGFGVLDPHDENKKTLTRKVLNKAEVIIIDEVSMCRIDLFERVMNMVLAAKRVSGRKQVVLVGDFFQLPPVVTDDDRKVLMQLWPGTMTATPSSRSCGRAWILNRTSSPRLCARATPSSSASSTAPASAIGTA